ncbi:MAG: hypothetical protein CMH56_11420 [Myxococcales bacterium]|mgnify:FL=1|nr:hypothetical protein [Myxococcales bacterium]|tara:strand:+ start:628 stop:1929 length:1302 start_codon:yes stop_codon:yes gene_type:complete
MGIKRRLLLIVTLIMGASLATGLFVLNQIEIQNQKQENTQRVGALLASLSAPVAFSLVQGRIPDLDNLMDQLLERKEDFNLSHVALFDHQGLLVGQTGTPPSPHALPKAFIEKAVAANGSVIAPNAQGYPLRISMPVETGIRWATLVATLDWNSIQQSIAQREKRISLTIVALALIALITLLMSINRWVLAPVVAVAKVAQKFAEGDLSARIHLPGAGEITRLARVLNMAGERLSRQKELLEQEVAKRTDDLKRANERLEKLAITDGLTGLYNHRYFQEMLIAEVQRQRRGGSSFSLIMLDVDHFKKFNDEHGHPAGDEILHTMGEILSENVRETDLVARYGGEEFVILLRFADHDDAVQVAEKLRHSIEGAYFSDVHGTPRFRCTASLGVATWPEHAKHARPLIEIADQALYQSKRLGRNRITSVNDLEQTS